MAWGKPVVASAVGGVPEDINSPHVGVLVPKGNEQALADAITALLQDEPRRVAIGRAARARIAHELSREHHLAAIAAHLQRADPTHPVALNSR
jgi:glycosyltransferase involved in cell wall biosynthesis